MAIKEGIVLCKWTGELVGFENLNISVHLNIRLEDLNDNKNKTVKISHQNQQILTHCLLHQTRMTLVLHYPVLKTPHRLKKVNLSVSSSFHH